MYGLCVRFTCKDEASAEAYDRLVAETVEAIKANEPGTLVYASHLVYGQPLQRIFYELYRDKAALEAHEAAPHTRRYLAERDRYLASTQVDRLILQTGKGIGG
jgi:quinol monooxygenase YgiN